MDAHERFLTLFLQNQAGIKAFILSVLRDRQAGEDILQEVALILWKEFDRYDPARPFGAWARGIAQHKVLQDRQRMQRFPLALSNEALQAVADAYDRAEPGFSREQEALRDCMDLLQEKPRRLLALRYERSLKLHEIAQELNNSLDAVHKALSRIRAGLQECVEQKLAHGKGV